MTPDRRLDQLEPLMADSLQKIDRLIEGQGQLVELATTTKSELDQVKKTGELTANGLANLTIYVQQGFAQVDQRFVEVQQGFADVDQRFVEVQQGFAQVDQRFTEVQQGFADVDQRFIEVQQEFTEFHQNTAQINAKVDSLRDELNQRFDQLVTLIQERF